VGVSGSQVAIFRGVSDNLPGLSLSELYEVQDLPVASLPVYYQERVRGSIEVPSLDAARETVTELRDAVTRCGRDSPDPSASASATATATSTPSSTTTGRPSPSSGAVSLAPSASPSAGPTC
jgi:hypothetical protein